MTATLLRGDVTTTAYRDPADQVVAALETDAERGLGEAETVLYRPGTNLAIWSLTLLFHGRLPASALLEYHPFAVAAWFGMLATALNLLPMGQLEGQTVLWRLHPVIERVGREAAERAPDDLWSFTPGLDIQGMLHERLEARLFRS